MASRQSRYWERLPKPLRILHARPKLVFSLAAGTALALLLPAAWRPITRALLGWDAALALYLAIVYWTVARSEADHIRGHAAQEDEGRLTVLMLTIGATAASLAAIIVLLGQGSGKNDPLQLVFASGTIFLSWAMVHSIFALHYAHVFYSSGGGLKFPGPAKPHYWDFVYFAFVVGMTFQVSDVAITSPVIRRTVTAHAIVAFVFNVALMAIMINVAASALG
jgi:uncharacterized membrane protein